MSRDPEAGQMMRKLSAVERLRNGAVAGADRDVLAERQRRRQERKDRLAREGRRRRGGRE